MKEKKVVCPVCGAENSEDSNFCLNCGAILKGDTVATKVVEKSMFYPGAIIDDRYEIIKIIGKGGMGVVFYAKDRKLKKAVAIKTLSFSLIKDEDFKNRLLREAITLGQIEHPNICSVYDVVIKKEYSYIVMQYVEGENLAKLLKKGKLPLEQAIDIGIQLSEGLSAAHKKGIVHRDIKPSNIVISKDGYVKILDFGLAKPYINESGKNDSSIDNYEITKTGVIVGTVSYMSPEQAEGGKVDHRSDIFSLGIILYEMFTGENPFSGKSHISIMANIINKEIIPPNNIVNNLPEGVNEIIKKTLRKKPEERYQDATDIKNELLKIKHGENPRKVKITKRRGKGKPAFKRILSISVLIIIFIMGLFLIFHKSKKPLIIVSDAEVDKNISKIIGEEVSFLLIESLSQFENYEIMSQNSFDDLKRKWGGKEKAMEKEKVILFIKPKIKKIGKMINIDTHLNLLNSKKILTINGEGKKSILDYQIDNIVERLGNTLNKNKRIHIKKISDILTSDWDAFVNFFHGYKFWKNLYISQSEKFLKKALNYDSKLALAYYYLSEISIFNGDYISAKKYIDSAKLNGKNLINYDRYKIFAMEENLKLNFDKQRKYLKMIIKIKPRDKLSYYALAESYFHRGEAEEALKYYAKVLSIDSGFSPALNHAGFCYSYLGDHIKALDYLEKYKELNGGANAYDSLGDGYFYMGDYLNARNNKLTALNIDPNLDWIYYSLGYIYFMQHNFKKAFDVNKEYNKKSKTKRYKALSLVQLAFFKLHTGKIADAEKLVEQAEQVYTVKEINGFTPEIYYFKGLVALKAGNIKKAEEALKVFETIVKKYRINRDRFFPLLKFYLSLKAHIKFTKGDINGAVKNMEKLLSMKEKLGYWSTFFNYSYFLNDYLELLKEANKIKEFNHWIKILNEYNPYFRKNFDSINNIMDK